MDEEQQQSVLLLSGNNKFYDELMACNFETRHLVINQDITEDLIDTICLYIFKWNLEDKDIPKEKRKKIYIYINSDGGDTVTGNMILSAIQCSETPVVTIGLAKCSSMASYILAAGSKRYCFPNTVVLYHDGSSGYYASSNKGKDIQKFYDNLDEILTRFLIKNTNMSEDFLEKIKDREYYMFAEEAKSLGIVDCIIGVDCGLDEIL